MVVAALHSTTANKRASRLNAEAEDLRGEIERLKQELGETRAENEALQKAEKQRAANAALLVKGALDLARLSVVALPPAPNLRTHHRTQR
jgi:DNA repair exonuclease SbcCD ATPase subunit